MTKQEYKPGRLFPDDPAAREKWEREHVPAKKIRKPRAKKDTRTFDEIWGVKPLDAGETKRRPKAKIT